jgi:hypothetical protein
MKSRILFNLLAGISLALCAVIIVLWVRSYTLSDQIEWQRHDGKRWFHSAQGHLVLGHWLSNQSGQAADFYGVRYVRDASRPVIVELFWMLMGCINPGETNIRWERCGFAWYEKRRADRSSLTATAVAPFWFLCGLTAAAPLGWTTVRVRSHIQNRRREGKGLCLICGYDLRATPDRCPECGTVPSGVELKVQQSHIS